MLAYLPALFGVALSAGAFGVILRLGLRGRLRVYAMMLASFPVYYWVFAAYGADREVLSHEVAVGTVFFGAAYVGPRLKCAAGFALLSVAYALHGAYDVFHDRLFVNDGTPEWWPMFCGTVDVALSLGLALHALRPSSGIRTPFSATWRGQRRLRR